MFFHALGDDSGMPTEGSCCCCQCPSPGSHGRQFVTASARRKLKTDPTNGIQPPANHFSRWCYDRLCTYLASFGGIWGLGVGGGGGCIRVCLLKSLLWAPHYLSHFLTPPPPTQEGNAAENADKNVANLTFLLSRKIKATKIDGCMLLLLVDAAEDPLEAGVGASLWALLDKVLVVAHAMRRARLPAMCSHIWPCSRCYPCSTPFTVCMCAPLTFKLLERCRSHDRVKSKSCERWFWIAFGSKDSFRGFLYYVNIPWN